jgi:hypothetical protein
VPIPPLLSEGAIIGISVAVAVFITIVLLGWSKKMRSEGLV